MSDDIDIDKLRAHAVEPVPAIVWDDIECLRPGVDFKGGVTYVTVPAKLNTIVTEGKGKAAKDKVVLVEGLALIGSDRHNTPYTPAEVQELGYGYPELVSIPDTRRWSKESIADFLHGKTTEPDPVTHHAGIKAVYEEYIEFADEAYYDILPLYVLGTYMFRHFRSIGYIHFNGTMASGKSQNLNILNALCLNPAWASSMSAASLFRQVAGIPGTILLDEAEGWDGERGEELRRILNAGYLDGATVKRVEKGKNEIFQVNSYASFGPKAIASINPLDPVIGSRCLVVAMRPAVRKIPEFNAHEIRWTRLRDRLYLWAMYHGAGVGALADEWNTDTRYARAPRLISRQWQITQIYIVIADYIDRFDDGDRCERLITFFNQHFAELQRNQDATERVRIVLKVLPRVLAEKTPKEASWYRLKDIHEEVLDRLEADQADYYRTRNLAKHLEILGFREKRNAKGGMQYWLDAEAIRAEFTQRRVEPYPEDLPWLNHLADYNPPAIINPIHDHAVSVWGDEADQDMNN